MFHPLLFTKKLSVSPVFNLLSLCIVFLSIASLFADSLFPLSLSFQSDLSLFERLFLCFFLFETVIRTLRFSSIVEYFRSTLLWIDLLSVIPALLLIIFDPNNLLPGAIILRGGRLLRLIPLYQFFTRERSMGLRPAGSQLEFRLLSSSALLLYFFLLVGGATMSIIHARLSNEERSSRLLRVHRFLDTQGLQGVQDLFPDRILKVEKRTPGESYDLYFADQSFIQNHMRIEKDFVYVEGRSPDEGVLLSFFDLNRRQVQFEAGMLATGLLMIAAIAVVFHTYFRDKILRPVERAKRVMDLRIKGEEIESTDIGENTSNEITDLIHSIDHFYRIIREKSGDV